MSSNPTSFRFPFTLPDDVHPSVAAGIRYAFNGLLDVNQAIAALVPKVNSISSAVGALGMTTQIVSGGTPPTTVTGIGSVNLQPIAAATTYTVQSGDFGALILCQSTPAFAISLDSGLMPPFYTSIYNLGSGTVTLTATQLGLINNNAHLTLKVNQGAVVYFDGVSWWAFLIPVPPISEPKVLNNWLDSYDSTTGLFTQSQPCAKNLCDSTVGAGPVVLDSGATLIGPTIYSTMSILNLQIFATNAAALSGGLVPGNVYRNGANPDLLCVVH